MYKMENCGLVSDPVASQVVMKKIDFYTIVKQQQEFLNRYNLGSEIDAGLVEKFANIDHIDKPGDYCSACLTFVSPQNGTLYNPCKCSFFKIHKNCLPIGTYLCKRCHVYYGRDVVYSSILRFVFVGRCRAAIKKFPRLGKRDTYRCYNFAFRSRFCSKHST